MKHRSPSSWLLLSAFGLGLPMTILAQEPIEEVVVTGTRIEGTAKDGQLPVDVYTAADMESRASCCQARR